jgi:membrane-bound lytic murein transglycosylase D
MRVMMGRTGRAVAVALAALAALSPLPAQATGSGDGLAPSLDGLAPSLDGRPLRARRPDTPPLSALAHPAPLPSPRSLLTPEAVNQPLTRFYIERYASSGGVAWLNAVIGNGSVYLLYIKEEIARRGLPPELAYLPFIESGYVGTARSKSGAAGLWQFMMNSIAPYNIKVDEVIDERRDFRKSTAAALHKLAENYHALGDWPLALAAYNAGMGAVSRAVKEANVRDYWLLCDNKRLRTETVHYVPKFLAVSYILAHSRRFGVDYWPPVTEWTTVKPGKQVSLDVIAREAGVDRGLLYRLNTELLYGITPADAQYELKIPRAHTQAVAGLLAREDAALLRYYRYQIRYGDTLSALSRHYGVSIDMIDQHNPGIKSRHLKIGETVIIPALRETGPYTGGSAVVTRHRGGGFTGTHVVAQGDTLWSLAIRYQVDPQVLAEENGMDLNQILSIGKALKVPIMGGR